MSSFIRPSKRFTKSDVTLIKTEHAFKGYFSILRHHVRHKRFDGGETPVFTREVFERGHAVALIPYDPVTDRVVLIEQFRAAPFSVGDHAWSIEIPAGIIEDGEKPEDVAVRELKEETGLEASDIRYLFRLFTTPGGSTETATYFYARVNSAETGGFHGVEHENEDIAVFTLPLDEALDLVEKGEINNAFAVIALQWLAINKSTL